LLIAVGRLFEKGLPGAQAQALFEQPADRYQQEPLPGALVGPAGVGRHVQAGHAERAGRPAVPMSWLSTAAGSSRPPSRPVAWYPTASTPLSVPSPPVCSLICWTGSPAEKSTATAPIAAA